MRSALTALGFAACFGASAAYAQEPVSDPWEGFNRDMFAVHETLDRAVFEPVARGYRAVAPSPVRTGVRNVLRNLRSPVIFVNDLLQAQGERAAVTAVRFGVNTTVGLLGIFDPAASLGLERHEEDFGQTLAVWGVDAGPYLFVPLIGPTNLRDGAGRIVDLAFDPLTWAEGDDIGALRASRTAAAGLAARENAIEAVESVRRDSLDPYTTIRSAHGLLRESAIRNGAQALEDLPEFEDPMTPEPAEPPVGAPPQPQQNPNVHGGDALASAKGAPKWADNGEKQ